MRRENRQMNTSPVRSLIDDFLKNAFFEPEEEDSKLMAMDVIERDKEYILKANLPGIKKKDIKVYIEGDNLVLEARRSEEKEEKSETMYRSERYRGDYRRLFSIPKDWDYENISAKYENGVLNLTIPKKEIKPEKEISVK
jgi:HSP20 family protein